MPAIARRPLPTAAYLHVPFCRRRCFYCDFPVSVVGDFPPAAIGNSGKGASSSLSGASALGSSPPGSSPPDASPPDASPSGSRQPGTAKPPLDGSNSGTIARYVEALGAEIDRAAASRPSDAPPLETVFFGGGTPSLLSVSQLDRLLGQLDRHWGIAAGAEISVEMDPGTFDREKLAGYLDLGVNRVSLGVQAFQDRLLQACGRSHRVADIETAIGWVRAFERAGTLPHWSLDLISGLPHQTPADWADSLDRAIALAPPHLSVYDLTLEAQTPFGKQYRPGAAPLPPESVAAQLYRQARDRLVAAGYDHYEISNYARPGHQCRHNRVYWENRPYYGFGMGATSYVGGRRFGRPRKTSDYYDWVAAGCSVAEPPETASDRRLDALMLGLRLAEGVAIADLTEGCTAAEAEDIRRAIARALRPHWQAGRAIVREGAGRSRAPGEGATGSSLPESSLPESGLPESTGPSALPADGRLALSDPEGFLVSNVVLSDLFAALDPDPAAIAGGR